MAQFLRPDSTVTATGFTGGFAEIDEATASDADYAASGANKTTETLEVSLGNPSGAPSAGTSTFRYRIRKSATGGDTVTVVASVVQGTTVLSSDASQTAPDAFTTLTFPPDLSGVTDWNDLRLRFVKNASGGGGGANRRGLHLSWAELETPDAAAAITGAMAATETGTDVFSASGTVADPSVTGTLAAQESGADAFAGSGSVAWQPITGTLAATESGSDDFTALGALAILGAFAAVETGADTFTGSGSASGAISGALSAFEAGADDFTASGQIPLSGALAALDTGIDSFSASGTVTTPGAGVTGAMAAVESGNDTMFASLRLIWVPVLPPTVDWPLVLPLVVEWRSP